MRHLKTLISFIFLSFWMLHAGAATVLPASPPSNFSNYPPDIAAIKKSGVLRVAMYEKGSPSFFMQDASGNWSGIDIDLENMIAAGLGVKLVIIPMSSYDGMVNAVITGKADLAMGLLSITPERALQVKFAHPIYAYHPAILVNRLKLEQLGWTMPDLMNELAASTQPIKIGAIPSSANTDLLHRIAPTAQIVAFPSEDQALQAVSDGTIFAAIGDTPEYMTLWLNKNPHTALTTIQGLVSTRSVLFGIAMSWKAENLRQWLDIFLENIQSQNILTDLFTKYGVPPPQE